jgi:hypothetical protein
MNEGLTKVYQPDASQQTAARVAGATYLFTFAIVVIVNFMVHEPLFKSDAAETARNILAHERLFRFGIAADLVYCVGLLVLLTALYLVLRPAGRGIALLAAFSRLVYMMMWVLMTLSLFDVLRLLGTAPYLHTFEPERLQAVAKFALRSRFDLYYVGLLFYGLASTLCAYLFYRARYLPRGLAAFGVAGSAWAVICTVVFIVFPSFSTAVNLWWFDTPLGLFELATGVWLLWKGIPPSVPLPS